MGMSLGMNSDRLEETLNYGGLRDGSNGFESATTSRAFFDVCAEYSSRSSAATATGGS